jgi:hypothetical protein
MSDLREVCVVDCGEVIERFMSITPGATEEDMSAILVSAATSAVDGVYTDPMLELGSAVQPVQASVMVGALRAQILDVTKGAVTRLANAAGEYQVVRGNSRLEGRLVVIDIDLVDEGD